MCACVFPDTDNDFYYSNLHYSERISPVVDRAWRREQAERRTYDRKHTSMAFLSIKRSMIDSLINHFDTNSKLLMEDGIEFVEISRLYFVNSRELLRIIAENRLVELRERFQENINKYFQSNHYQDSEFRMNLELNNIFVPPVMGFLKEYAPIHLANLEEDDYIIFTKGQKGFGFFGGKSNLDENPYDTVVRELNEELYLSGKVNINVDIGRVPLYKEVHQTYISRRRSKRRAEYIYVGKINYNKKLI